LYLTFSDLPFPITMNSSDSYMELVSYSKIE
jgi:cephalosporin-C deacetylase-like acetyl esterase